ncbi:MAG: DNA-binding protein [Lachnospiraceae bacterium]|nr:DNA-binding protein [Lachnospiraceae bacterium]
MDAFMTIKETAIKWGLTTRRVQEMCSNGQIEGVQRFGNAWAIPIDAERPKDGRVTTGLYRNWRKNK